MQARSYPWRLSRGRALLLQGGVLLALLALLAWCWHNASLRLAAQGVSSGFGFLQREAGFAIAETPIAWSPADTYLRALGIGLLNTLKVSLPALLLASALGVAVGIALGAQSRLWRRLARGYVESLRNVPLLLQLFVWYGVFSALPPPRQAPQLLPGVFLSGRGLLLPAPLADLRWLWLAGAALLAVGLAWALYRRRWPLPVLLPLPPLAAVGSWWALGAPPLWSLPVLGGFNFHGGLLLSPEFAALGCGLAFYSASYIAEIVRGGIDAVPAGQREAGLALGLRRAELMRLIVLPQALRVMLPPLAGQYLSLIKNSSLAVAIGYPDLVSIANTAINQTGQAISGILLIMLAYLSVSLVVAALMAWWNRRLLQRGEA
ncbi:amino acid ABC transporter permease [Plasticicumulans acidivorans]|uniref:General L-amino acid transport system permease protein n=1 Tax=Plasticicumulans acidivorans TaxID=886464 RepID=A0A317MZY0_9GAMM|nr:ABC transporter permease subunit [Plasticicumulans acidivorans]PWV65881.1 general L-amino acid transport system permease protein [Plasticicumulans acidivorans]